MSAAATDWIASFPDLAPLAPSSVALLRGTAQALSVSRDRRIFRPGDTPAYYLLALSGSVRVQKTSESGREIVLYRVHAGQSCVLTTACLIGQDAYEAEAIAETDVEAIGIPRATFEALVAADETFRRFVFAGFSTRVTDLLRLIDEVVFERVDTRLAHKLIDLSDDQGLVSKTQAQLASELGSAREVVSRQLQEFQRRGWILLARGTINICDRDALARHAGLRGV